MTSLAASVRDRFPFPRTSPDESETPRRRLTVAPDRVSPRRRPRIVYAAVAIAGIAIITLAQLLLSISLSDGAYEISSLQSQQKVLSRTNQALNEQVTTLDSPQHLVTSAEGLGMVANGNTVYLRLSDGAVLGSPAVASADTAPISNGQDLVPNALLAPRQVQAASNPGATSAPPTAQQDPTVPWKGALPSPTTR